MITAAGADDMSPTRPAEVLTAIGADVERGLKDIEERVSQTTSAIGLFGSRQGLGDDYLTRAAAANIGIYGQVAEEAVYGGSRPDAGGEQLMGDQHYELRFDRATLPTRTSSGRSPSQLPSRFLAANPTDRYSIGDRTPGIAYADDASLTIILRVAAANGPTQRANTPRESATPEPTTSQWPLG